MNGGSYQSYLNRMLSADTIVPDPSNPQTHNRYSYVNNNPINFTDPSGHCGKIVNAEGEEAGRDSEDQECWDKYDELHDFMINNAELAKYFEYDAKKSEDKTLLQLRFKLGIAKTTKVQWSFQDRFIPDAAVIGFSGDIGGGLGGPIAGAENLWLFETSEIKAFGYGGYSIGGTPPPTMSADIGASGGFVWNLDCVECYKGEFWVMSVDASLATGYEITLFGSPGATLFDPEGTWGVTAGPTIGAGISGTSYIVDYDYMEDIFGWP